MTTADAGASDIVLCLNSGSSSLKFSLFEASDRGEREVLRGAIEGIGGDRSRAWVAVDGQNEHGDGTADCAACTTHANALNAAFDLLGERGQSVTIVGHRVVHGGVRHVAPTLVNDVLVAELNEIVPLAPLHLPFSLAAVAAVCARLPQVPQVACFDTAFHATLPEIAWRFALPRHVAGPMLRRYGFHGLSFEYVMSVLGDDVPSRLVIAHLGSGASLVAVRDGRAIDTTMGLTPTGGIPMATRTGDLDPGVVFYLMREEGLTLDAVERLVNHESGLLGVGGSTDMRTLIERAASSPDADLAIAMFGYAVRKAIGAFVAALGGIDLLVFTGGIGEHVARVRAEACHGLEDLGIRLDPHRNALGEAELCADGSRCRIRIIATDEDRMIARHARSIVRAQR